MRVFLQPTGICYGARAFQRISRALARYAPPHVAIVDMVDEADLQVLYVISADVMPYAEQLVRDGKDYAVVQCCYLTAGGLRRDWQRVWAQSKLVWSYFDLRPDILVAGVNFYHAPLGLDDAFIQPFDLSAPREPLCITTGYCDGPQAEAISEVWQACSLVGLRCLHIGPNKVEGMLTQPTNWTAREGVTDEELASLYSRAKFVGGLRYVEGYECPAMEGASMGATPLVFDGQPAMRHWYNNIGLFVPECSGEKLVDQLSQVLRYERSTEVRQGISEIARARFNWQRIATGFWERCT